MIRCLNFAIFVLGCGSPLLALAEPGLPALSVSGGDGGQNYTLSLQFLALITAVTLLPAALLMMTSFTRIMVVLAILRQAIGTAQTPSNQILLGLALFLSFFIMMPVLSRVYSDAVQPYMNEQVSAQEALDRASTPVREFMLSHTRRSDLSMYAEISGHGGVSDPADIPFTVLLPSFVTSELKTAFQIGFILFIPFLIIDLVVASVLMSMGMMMMSPMIVSLPFKLMLFVMVDGWSLILGTLASSFYV